LIVTVMGPVDVSDNSTISMSIGSEGLGKPAPGKTNGPERHTKVSVLLVRRVFNAKPARETCPVKGSEPGEKKSAGIAGISAEPNTVND
jgi:hypothetical protein